MKLKSIFTSRWGSEGCLIEADWSSLEIIGWAFLTKDPMLYKLIKSGRDMHKYVGSYVLDIPEDQITKEQRSEIKGANFALVYGGTDWNLQKQAGLSVELSKKVYDTFWNLFPVARLWSDNLMRILDINSYEIDELSPGGTKRRESWYQGPTGRKFFFKNYPDKISSFCAENRIYTPKGFKYSEGMNYQVQSFCTADIHMIALGLLFRKAQEYRDRMLLINTVHDSVLVDCKLAFLEECVMMIKSTMESVVQRLREKFGIDFDLPLKVECKSGPSWGQMERVDIDSLLNNTQERSN